MANIKNKTVSFNQADPDEADLLAHALKRTNFSRYIKSLISKDMNGATFDKLSVKVPHRREEPQDDGDNDHINKNTIRGFI